MIQTLSNDTKIMQKSEKILKILTKEKKKYSYLAELQEVVAQE